MWSVVLFSYDNSVAAVPSHWYKNGQCGWPKKYIKTVNKYIEKRTATNALEFDFYSARKLNTEKAIGMIIYIELYRTLYNILKYLNVHTQYILYYIKQNTAIILLVL